MKKTPFYIPTVRVTFKRNGAEKPTIEILRVYGSGKEATNTYAYSLRRMLNLTHEWIKVWAAKYKDHITDHFRGDSPEGYRLVFIKGAAWKAGQSR